MAPPAPPPHPGRRQGPFAVDSARPPFPDIALMIGQRMSRSQRSRSALVAIWLLTTGAFATANPPTASAAINPVAVTVNARAGMATMPETGLGINHAIWDAQLGSDQTTDLLKAA